MLFFYFIIEDFLLLFALNSAKRVKAIVSILKLMTSKTIIIYFITVDAGIR